MIELFLFNKLAGPFNKENYVKSNRDLRILHLPISNHQVFVGNSDRDTVVKNPVISPVKARYIRLIPTEWHNHISMRIELYGCLGRLAFRVHF